MSKVVSFKDDLDGSDGATTRYYTIGGRSYEIDLNDSNNDKLEKALARFIKVSRDVTPSQRRPTSDIYAGVDVTAARAWGIAQGWDVNKQGRIPISLVEAYKASLVEPETEEEEPPNPPSAPLTIVP